MKAIYQQKEWILANTCYNTDDLNHAKWKPYIMMTIYMKCLEKAKF